MCRSVQHLIDAVASETFHSELPLGIITLDGGSPQTLMACLPSACAVAVRTAATIRAGSVVEGQHHE